MYQREKGSQRSSGLSELPHWEKRAQRWKEGNSSIKSKWRHGNRNELKDA